MGSSNASTINQPIPRLAFAFGQVQAQSYNFDSNTSGTTGTFANGWTGTPTTNYSWRADAAGTGSPGTGPDVDHTLGTAAGIYIYTEASAPAVQGDTAVFTSPNISLAGFTNPGMSFWFHMAGTSMGDLYIDVLSGGVWDRGIDSIIGTQQAATADPWLEKKVNLTAYTGMIQVRFRGIRNVSWSGDIAIDDVSFIELPAFDGSMVSYNSNPFGITQFPLSQAFDIGFGGEVGSFGASALTNVKMWGMFPGYLDSASTATLAAGATTQLSLPTVWNPAGLGTYDGMFWVGADQSDTLNGNDTLAARIIVSDSIFARDDSLATGSLGIGGNAGILGQNFTLRVPDVLTSVSFFLNGPIAGDTTFVEIYDFNGTPQSVIATSNSLIIPTANPGWYTLTFPCPKCMRQ
ncbi:MAG: hypothetical protein AAF570_24700 [Bacteroidota bacterium]